MFNGFSDRAVQFYAELEADNSKAFWNAHKSVYESEVRDPMRELLAELEPEFGPGKIFRPYQDARFNRDLPPYKTRQAAFVGTDLGIGYYVQLDADGLVIGGGFRSHGAAEVERYRRAVDDDKAGPELGKLVARLREQGFQINGDPVKTRPRGYPADHPRMELLRNRSVMVSQAYGTPSWLATAAACDEIRSVWRSVMPLSKWVQKHVGA